MTVKELRELLGDFPDDMQVIVNAGRNELGNGKPVSGVETLNMQRYPGSPEWYEHWGDWFDPECQYQRMVNVRS